MIVAWNSGDYLDRAVAALNLEDQDADLNVIVIDNASTDGAPARVAERFPQVRVRRFSENRGFAAGCNAGARELGNVNYLLFLNPDTEVTGQTVRRAANLLDVRHSDQAGICGIALRDSEGSVRNAAARAPTLGRYVSYLLGLDRLDWSWLPRSRYLPVELLQQRFVEQVCGAFFMVRADLFTRLGGFDERFFVYYEEAEFSLRARQAGWHSLFAAELDGFHEGEATSRSIPAERLFFVTRSRILFMEKHRSGFACLVHFLLTVLVEPFARTALCLSRADLRGARDVWDGFWRLYCWLILRRLHGR